MAVLLNELRACQGYRVALWIGGVQACAYFCNCGIWCACTNFLLNDNFLRAVLSKDLYIESDLGDSAAGDTWTR